MRVSPLVGKFDSAKFTFGFAHGMTIALARRQRTSFEDYLVDLSAYPKILLVGEGAPDLLKSCDLQVPSLCTRYSNGRGQWVACVSPTRYLMSGDDESINSPSSVGATAGPAVTVLPHDMVELALGGACVPAILAELTALDFTQFGANAWIPAVFAGIDVALYRARRADELRVLCAPADGPYLFETLTTLMRERGGAVIGINEYETLELSLK